MTEATTSNLSFDDLLDATIDDLADMPEFKPFAAGAHKLTLNFDYSKKINDLPVVEVKLTIVESVELADPNQVPPAKGDTTNVLYMLKKKDDNGAIVNNELAQGQLKELLKSLAPAFPEAKSNREIMDAAQGYEVLASTGIRENKKDKNNIKYYTDLKAVQIL